MDGRATVVEAVPDDDAIRGDRSISGSALLPQRNPTDDLLVCDVLDTVPKNDAATMEHPIFSLPTKADTRVLRYEHITRGCSCGQRQRVQSLA